MIYKLVGILFLLAGLFGIIIFSCSFSTCLKVFTFYRNMKLIGEIRGKLIGMNIRLPYTLMQFKFTFPDGTSEIKEIRKFFFEESSLNNEKVKDLHNLVRINNNYAVVSDFENSYRRGFNMYKQVWIVLFLSLQNLLIGGSLLLNYNIGLIFAVLLFLFDFYFTFKLSEINIYYSDKEIISEIKNILITTVIGIPFLFLCAYLLQNLWFISGFLSRVLIIFIGIVGTFSLWAFSFSEEDYKDFFKNPRKNEFLDWNIGFRSYFDEENFEIWDNTIT